MFVTAVHLAHHHLMARSDISKRYRPGLSNPVPGQLPSCRFLLQLLLLPVVTNLIQLINQLDQGWSKNLQDGSSPETGQQSRGLDRHIPYQRAILGDIFSFTETIFQQSILIRKIPHIYCTCSLACSIYRNTVLTSQNDDLVTCLFTQEVFDQVVGHREQLRSCREREAL